MKTRVEVEIPFGSEEAFIATTQDFGGKVIGVRTEPIVAGGINPSRLLRHIQKNGVQIDRDRNLSDSFQRTSFSKLFTFLRELPFDQQRYLLESFLGHSMRDSQTGVRLGGFLARVNNINWLEPHEEPKVEELQQVSDGFYQQLGVPSLPVALVREDWRELGKLIMDNFVEDFKGTRSVTYSVERQSRVSELDRQARINLGAHRDYREAYVAGSLVGSILGDIDGGHWGRSGGRIRELLYYGGEGYGNEDFAKMGATTALRADTELAAMSLVLERHLPNLGYIGGVMAEGLFNGVYDKGYVFMGPMNGQSVIFVPTIRN